MNMIEINDIADEALDIYARLREPELLHYYEPEQGIFIAESPKVIRLALAAGYEPLSFLSETRYVDRELKELQSIAGLVAGISAGNSAGRSAVKELQSIAGLVAGISAGNSGGLPAEHSGGLPAEHSGGLPAEHSGGLPAEHSGGLPAELSVGSSAGISNDVPVYIAEESVLMNITGFKLTRGMLCAMRRKPSPDPVDLCKDAVRIAVLENVVNPTNMGAIMRSAAAMNMDAVLLTPDCCDPLYRRSIRVSMGTVFQIPWTYINHNYMDFIKSMGFASVAMAIEERAVDLNQTSFSPEEKLAVILGNEGAGLNQETISSCDHLVKIPMRAGVDSLNVAAASAVAFYELGRKHL